MPPSISMTNSGSAIALVALANPGSTLPTPPPSPKPSDEPVATPPLGTLPQPIQTTQGGGTSSQSSELAGPGSSEAAAVTPVGLSKVKLSELLPEDGAASGTFFKAIESLSLSLARYSAAIIQLNVDEQALVKCALDSARLYFKSRAGGPAGSVDWTKSGGYYSAPAKDMYFYRAGRLLAAEEHEWTPPCMSQVFRCFGKASRAALAAISRHLRLRSDALGTLLDDCPLPTGEVSSSVLTATCHHSKVPSPNQSQGEERLSSSQVEKGLLMLVASDMPGLQVCDSSSKWFPADHGLASGDLVLLTGRALHQATAGMRLPSTYQIIPPTAGDLQPGSSGRCSLAFRLMPRPQAVLDCSAMLAAGHPVPEAFQEPVPVSTFMDTLTNNESSSGSNSSEVALASLNKADGDPSLRAILTDPATGALLEDAMVSQCGHSFGGASLRRLLETMVCPWCGAGVDVMALVPNLGLRAAVAAYKRDEAAARHQAAIRGAKRRREREAAAADGRESGGVRAKKLYKSQVSGIQALEYPGFSTDAEASIKVKGVQFPYAVNDYVLIKGNKRTPEKFVGREAIITNQCLNGWYLVRTLDTGESVRLQYRSLQRSLAHRSSGTKGIMEGDVDLLRPPEDDQHDCPQSDDHPLFPQSGIDPVGAFALSPLALPAPYSPARGGESPSRSPFPTETHGGEEDPSVSEGSKNWRLTPLQEGVSASYGAQLMQGLEPGEFAPDTNGNPVADMRNAALQATPSLQALLQPVTRPRSPGRIGKNMTSGPSSSKVSSLGKGTGTSDGTESKSSELGLSSAQRPASLFLKVRTAVGKSALGSGIGTKAGGSKERTVKKEQKEGWGGGLVPGSSQSSDSVSGSGSPMSGGTYTSSGKFKAGQTGGGGCNTTGGEDSPIPGPHEEGGKAKLGASVTLGSSGTGDADQRTPVVGNSLQSLYSMLHSESQPQVVVPPKKRDLGSLTGKVHGSSSPWSLSGGYMSPSRPSAASCSPQRTPMSPPPDRTVGGVGSTGGGLVSPRDSLGDEQNSLQQNQQNQLPSDLFQGEQLPSPPSARQGSSFLDGKDPWT